MPTPDDSDWRLQGQEEYMTGVTLYKKSWVQIRPNWDHDHCEFCGIEFSDYDGANVLREGYTDKTDYRWVCETCFNDFQNRFSWRLAEHN